MTISDPDVMPDPDAGLGGRLPLMPRAQLTPPQASLWDRIDQTMGRWADDVGFIAMTTDGRFVGPFNPMLRSPDLAARFLELQLVESKLSSLGERIRQVVILSVGSIWQSDYELYAHGAAARRAGFSDAAIAALSAGEQSPELGDDEALAQRLALARDHQIPDGVFRPAKILRVGLPALTDAASQRKT